MIKFFLLGSVILFLFFFYIYPPKKMKREDVAIDKQTQKQKMIAPRQRGARPSSGLGEKKLSLKDIGKIESLDLRREVDPLKKDQKRWLEFNPSKKPNEQEKNISGLKIKKDEFKVPTSINDLKDIPVKVNVDIDF